MPLVLGTSGVPPVDCDYIVSEEPSTDGSRHRLPGLERALAEADAIAAIRWLDLAPALAGHTSGEWAHAPTCAGNASDFGAMLAWGVVGELWATTAKRIGLICDDPWLFRHLLTVSGVTASVKPPPIWPRAARLAIRGFASRILVTLRLAIAMVVLRKQRKGYGKQAPVLLVYGHPASDAYGHDGYFGDLMTRWPGVRRLLHVDCGVRFARHLHKDGRTFSLHAWGSWRVLCRLPSTRWCATLTKELQPYRWLVYRAMATEAGTGQAAMIRWQIHCQNTWLRQTSPRLLSWPWEGHAWERNLARLAREQGIPTVGYQHSTVGNREWNHSPRSAIDGTECLPDRIVCGGAAWRDRLVGWGCPPERINVGGSWRSFSRVTLRYDANGPVLVALPADAHIAQFIMDAIRGNSLRDIIFLVKDHPMTPFPFEEDARIRRLNGSLSEAGPVRAVIYAATTVGLEAALSGVPTLRFQPDGVVPNDVLPDGIAVPTVSKETLDNHLQQNIAVQPSYSPDAVFSPLLPEVWEKVLGCPLGSLTGREVGA